MVQINILNDIKVFCDKNYDNSAIKTNDGKYLTCGDGTFYDVLNADEITQINLGMNYYFDISKNVYIKCHKRCKTCSKEFNETNMNCDSCFENFFVKNGQCLEISKCEYNYYYDLNLDLKCNQRETSCPDFKPYEDAKTKECIANCDIDEFNNKCNPTNNLISINETYNKIMENIEYLKLKEKLFKNKEKYVIKGNNVTFIFSTSEIEKEELNSNFYSSSIIFPEYEKILRNKYLIRDNSPIPILKIETSNNYSNIIDVFYELFNPLNLSEKLNLNFTTNKLIEIRIPLSLKQYKMDLILKTKNLGYNIFDLNGSFYTDICSVFTYNDSDISLSERKNLLDLTDEVLCMNNCNNSNFDIKTLRSICLCKVGNYSEYDDTEENDKNKKEENSKNDDLFSNLTQKFDISKSLNIKVVKCFRVIFRKNLFTQNYGFYIMIFMNIFNIITLVFSPLSKVDKKLNKFCAKVIGQMKEIYDKVKEQKKAKANLINIQNNENNNNNINLIGNNNNNIDNNIHLNINNNIDNNINLNVNNNNIDNIDNINLNENNNNINNINLNENNIVLI